MCDEYHCPLASSRHCFFLVSSNATANMHGLVFMFLCHLIDCVSEKQLDLYLFFLSDHSPHFPAVTDALFLLVLFLD